MRLVRSALLCLCAALLTAPAHADGPKHKLSALTREDGLTLQIMQYRYRDLNRLEETFKQMQAKYYADHDALNKRFEDTYGAPLDRLIFDDKGGITIRPLPPKPPVPAIAKDAPKAEAKPTAAPPDAKR